MFEKALEDAGLRKPELTRLVNGLTAASGSEAMIALFDVAKVDLDASRKAIRDVAESLLGKFGVTE